MSKPKGTKNTYEAPAKQLCWEAQSDEIRAFYVDKARQNFRNRMKKLRQAETMPLDELSDLLGMKGDEET